MELNRIDIRKFKETIYPEYKKLFPELERKTYSDLERAYHNHIMDIIEIVEENQLVGFFITNFLENNPYVQLDYFAIFSPYQHKGYGTNAIKLLKEMYKSYDGIFIEIEKVGYGATKEENLIREGRAKFYENLGFYKMNFDLDLYTVIYSAYLLPCKRKEFSDKNVIKDIFQIYTAILGEDRVNKNCKVIKSNI